MLLMHIRIKQKTEKIMAKPDGNLCKNAPKNGVSECNREDLLTECKNLSKALDIPDVTEGNHNKGIIKHAI